jgi:hypothetical protein
VVILNYRQSALTLGVLESLARCDGPAFRVLVRDNGSGDEDDTVKRVRAAYPDVHVEAGEENLGVAGGRNAAARRAVELWDPEYLLFLDNDMEVEPAFVAELARPLDADPAIAQTQAKLRYMDDPTRINDGGGCRIVWWRGATEAVGKGEIDRGQYDEEKPCMACCGGAMMVRARVFRDLGGFDEAFNPFGPEDLDFSLRVLEAGHRNLYVPTAVTYHKVMHTGVAGYDEAYARNKVRSWFRLLRRHATLPQRLGFYLVGGPLAVLSMAWREARRGNLSAAVEAVRQAARVIRAG